ncbi:hypothetical protein ACOME3_005572 [Neoechinorhynchus agilis]
MTTNELPASNDISDTTKDPFKTHLTNSETLVQMLDSSKDSSILTAMRSIISLMARGHDMSRLFPNIVKNVASRNCVLQRLICLYISHYGQSNAQIGILAVSTYQKALRSSDQYGRAAALRTICRLGLKETETVAPEAVMDALNDMSPYVRMNAGMLIPSVKDSMDYKRLVGVVKKLYKEKDAEILSYVLGGISELHHFPIHEIAEVIPFMSSKLSEVDEWSLIRVIELIHRYLRSKFNSKKDTQKLMMNPTRFAGRPIILNSSQSNDSSFRYNENPAVVFSVCQLLYHNGPNRVMDQVVQSLMKMRCIDASFEYLCLTLLLQISRTHKSCMLPFLKTFCVRNQDPIYVRNLKLNIMLSLVDESNADFALKEFSFHIRSQMPEQSRMAIDSIGQCAMSVPSIRDACMKTVLELLVQSGDGDDVITSKCLAVLRDLIMLDSELSDKYRTVLVEKFPTLVSKLKDSKAMSSLISLITQEPKSCTVEMFKSLVYQFTESPSPLKIQILNLAAAIDLNQANHCQYTSQLVKYVLELARFDDLYDIRDRSLYLSKLLCPKLRHIASKVLVFDTFKTENVRRNESEPRYTIGSLSNMLKKKMTGYIDHDDFKSSVSILKTTDETRSESESTEGPDSIHDEYEECSGENDEEICLNPAISETEDSSDLDAVSSERRLDELIGLKFSSDSSNYEVARFYGSGSPPFVLRYSISRHTELFNEEIPEPKLRIRCQIEGREIDDVVKIKSITCKPDQSVDLAITDLADDLSFIVFCTVFSDESSIDLEANFNCDGTGMACFAVPINILHLIEPIDIDENQFNKEVGALRGINEQMAKVTLKNQFNLDHFLGVLFSKCSLTSLALNEKFVGQSFTSKHRIYLRIHVSDDQTIQLIVNSDKIMFGSLFLREIRLILEKM